ncbi:MAG: LapA family protein [Acidimicrobiia bacterium]|nr:LapA family protein [Acidimicrobiia bacterium]
MAEDGGERQVAPQSEFPIGLIGAGIVATILVIFIVSNNHQTKINFLWLDTTMPMWAVILIAGALGAFIGWTVSAIRRRTRRKSRAT